MGTCQGHQQTASAVPPHPVSLLFGKEHVTPCPSRSCPAKAVCLQAQGIMDSWLLPCCCGQHSPRGSSEGHQRCCSHLPPISIPALFHDCRAGWIQPGQLQTLNFPVLSGYCQCCFRWWLCKHPAGRATQDIAHTSILFPALCSLWCLPSSCWGWCYSEKTTSILGQAANAWLSNLGLGIALGKGNTGTDQHGFAQLSGQLLQTKALLRSCSCKGDKKRPDIPTCALPRWGGNRRALLALGKVALGKQSNSLSQSWAVQSLPPQISNGL